MDTCITTTDMKYSLLFLFFIQLTSSAQQPNDFQAPLNYVQVLAVEGDLDKDGKNEIVYVYDTNTRNKNLGFFRVLYICKIKDGKIKLWKKNTSVLRSSKECGFCLDKEVDLNVEIKNNTLIIKQTFNHNSRHYSTNKNIFRFQNGDWYLIGSTFSDYDTCAHDFQYDVNFSTKRVSVSETYGDCDEDKKIPEDQFYDFRYPFTKIPKMDGFKPGEVALKVPNSNKYFFY
jgi:hypothetical protein